ncbi:MAG: SRPBCC domain-containing protein [Bacteroidales bacterium]
MKDFKNSYIIPSTPDEVFIALTNPLTIELWSGYPAVMSVEPGSEFSLWDGDITGKNIEIEVNKKLIQEWYFGDTEIPSIATINLLEHKKGTIVELFHSNIPDEDFENITTGWNEYYFDAIIDFFTDDGE